MPANIQQPLRRRGAVSAEPINEEDAATYVKKVSVDLKKYKWRYRCDQGMRIYIMIILWEWTKN